MTFVKYSEFIAQKSLGSQFHVSKERYKEHIHAELSSLVLKKSDLFDEAKNYLINYRKIINLLENYPQAHSIGFALKSNSVESMKNCLHHHKENLSEKVRSLLETSIFNYESKILGNMFQAADVDIAVATLLDECDYKVRKKQSKISEALNTCGIDFPVFIEVKKPVKLIAENILVKIDSLIPFYYELNLENNDVTSHTKNLHQRYQKLHDDILNNMIFRSKSRLFSGYIVENFTDRNLFLMKRRELSLGVKSHLKKDTIIHRTIPDDNNDVWKIKLIDPEFYENDNCLQLTNDSQIRWIELVREKKNEE